MSVNSSYSDFGSCACCCVMMDLLRIAKQVCHMHLYLHMNHTVIKYLQVKYLRNLTKWQISAFDVHLWIGSMDTMFPLDTLRYPTLIATVLK